MNEPIRLSTLRDTQSQAVQPGNMPSVFNPDAWHAMQQRDDQLIRDSILHGYAGKEYVYKFKIAGQEVTGVSVVGARELASHYGGIKHRIVASVDKTGSLFVFKSFEPLSVQASIIPQLADEDDFYEVVIEITDLKSGNSIQVRKKETKTERRQNGSAYSRPHYDVIAESKAYRNGVLSIIPQSVIKDFERRALNSGNASDEKTIDQLREGAVKFGVKHGVTLDRSALNSLTYAEMCGLAAAASLSAGDFAEAAKSLGVVRTATTQIEHQHQEMAIPQQAKAPEPVAATRDDDERAYQQALAESLAKEAQAEGKNRRQRGGLGLE